MVTSGDRSVRARPGIRCGLEFAIVYTKFGRDPAPGLQQEEGRMAEANFDKFRGIIAEQLGVDVEKVTPEASFTDDLQADSLDLVELIMAFEEEYGMEISDEDAQKLRTVGEAWNYVKGKVSVA